MLIVLLMSCPSLCVVLPQPALLVVLDSSLALEELLKLWDKRAIVGERLAMYTVVRSCHSHCPISA